MWYSLSELENWYRKKRWVKLNHHVQEVNYANGNFFRNVKLPEVMGNYQVCVSSGRLVS